MASGRLFQARCAATAKARSPSVDLRVAGTVRSDDVTYRRRRRDSTLATGQTVEGSMVLIRVGSGIHKYTELVLYTFDHPQPVKVDEKM